MRNTIFQEPEIKVSVTDAWKQFKQLKVSRIEEPLLYSAFLVCMLMFLVVFLERLYMTVLILCLKAYGKKTYTQYKLDTVREMMERNKEHPRVLIQIPIYNRSKDYDLSIGAACVLKWPQERLIVQVIDFSTNEAMKAHVKAECRQWEMQGVNIKYENRTNIITWRIGALYQGLLKRYVNDCDQLVIFNPGFQPRNDFLMKTIPYLTENNHLGMVQARWTSVDDWLVPWLPETSLNYHFTVEQQEELSSYACLPFGIDDTVIGAWDIEAIVDAGRWKERCTADIMDLTMRSVLLGWKFFSLGYVC
ncbi:hypothetical protein DCAR_0312925 [Daucus carota subsp. sativus]|uniref:Glycosyltransferase 2-like domain-containing protein n=1 Tax=Daucus carota subsp. sativus TaxID=79200 RepID=A0A166BNJ5_DAUCS|nr:hypothetical protein DCAR_0312925 [Daucus carota subsp. sativus]